MGVGVIAEDRGRGKSEREIWLAGDKGFGRYVEGEGKRVCLCVGSRLEEEREIPAAV